MKLEGKIVFASGRTCDFDIWSLDLATSQLSQLTQGRNLNDQPSYSPDGSQIAFIQTAEDFIPSLCVMNADGSGFRRLTTNTFSQHPFWAPDGKSIVFTANSSDPNEIEICRFDLDSGKTEVILARHGQEREPSISPDGTKLLFSSIDPDQEKQITNPNTEIWEYDLSTKTERKICSHPARDYCPRYSPDGTMVAFVSHRNGRCEHDYLEQMQAARSGIEKGDRDSIDAAIAKMRALEMDSDIHVVNVDGTGLRQLTNNSGADVGVAWSPDGKSLVYSAAPKTEHQKERLHVIDLESGNIQALTYDRTALKREIGADPEDFMNRTIFQKLVPDFIEKRFADASFWGEERWPTWAA